MSARSSVPVSVLEEVLAGGQGWMRTVCVLTLAVLPPLALAQSGWVAGMQRLALLTAVATGLGLAFGGTKPRALPPALLVLGGLGLTLVVATDPPAEMGQAAAHLGQGIRRLYWWATVIWLGGSNDDPLAPTVFAGWALWLASLWLGWAVASRRSAMAAVLPVGVILAANTFFTVAGWGHMVAFVALTMLLLALDNGRKVQSRCTDRGLVCDPGVSAAAVALALPVAVGALLTALVLPPVTFERAADAFWARAESPWRTTVRLVKWLFPGLTPGAATSPWIDGGAGAAMPTARDLAAIADPEQTVIMYVETGDPPPLASPDHLGMDGEMGDDAPKRYWRGMTYNIYTGRGWANGGTDTVDVPGGEGLQDVSTVGREVAQEYRILVPRDELLYALAEPVAVSEDIRAYWRGEGDLAYLKAPIGRYEVVSRVIEPTEAQLRSAGDSYPLWVRDRYLALPEMPSRVQALVVSITEASGNNYDRLSAIENYLRSEYRYDLEVGEPADDKDVVDYFLFESRRGFCDHYASAMVVLARSIGIPARLASGYAAGTYDYEQGRYVVRASDAHSWPEAYFPGIGWVPFEPTVTQFTFSRPAGLDVSPSVPASSSASSAAAGRSSMPWVAAGAMLSAAGLAAWWLWCRHIPADPVLRAYWTMELAGARLGVDTSAATPREYASLLTQRVHDLSAEDGVDAVPVLSEVAVAYEERRYRRFGSALERGRHDNWRRAEGALLLLAARQVPRSLLTEGRRLARGWRGRRARG